MSIYYTPPTPPPSPLLTLHRLLLSSFVVVVGKIMVLTSNGVRATPNFKKISQMVQGCSGGHTNIHRQHGELTNLHKFTFFF